MPISAPSAFLLSRRMGLTSPPSAGVVVADVCRSSPSKTTVCTSGLSNTSGSSTIFIGFSSSSSSSSSLASSLCPAPLSPSPSLPSVTVNFTRSKNFLGFRILRTHS